MGPRGRMESIAEKRSRRIRSSQPLNSSRDQVGITSRTYSTAYSYTLYMINHAYKVKYNMKFVVRWRTHFWIMYINYL